MYSTHTENYKGARVLARLRYMDEEFLVRRKRYNGKPWRKYLVLTWGDSFMCAADSLTDVSAFTAYMLDQFEKTFPPGSESYFATELTRQKRRASGEDA